MRYMIISLLLVLGCSSFNHKDPELMPYLTEFFNIAGVEIFNETYSIEFSKLDDGVVGLCFPVLKKIYIDPKFWNRVSEIQRQSLLYHEGMHCFCGELNHNNENRNDGCSVSLMHEKQNSLKCLEKYWGYYLIDMQERCEEYGRSNN